MTRTRTRTRTRARSVPADAHAADAGERRGPRSRALLLDTAARHLRAVGYGATSLHDIAAEVGIRTPSLYYHFDSKDALVAEVLRIGIEGVAAVVSARLAALPDGASPTARIRAAAEGHLEALHTANDYPSAHVRCFHFVPRPMQVELRAARRRYEDIWRKLLESAARAGALRAGMDARHARLATLGMLNWSMEWFRPDRDDLRAFAATVCRLLTDDAVPRPRSTKRRGAA